jgi:hypothetical protein
VGAKPKPDLSDKWPIRLQRVRRSQARVDVVGMTRPARDPDEREFLRRTGQEGPFSEVTGADSGDDAQPA